MYLNKLFIVGRLTRAPEAIATANDNQGAKFSIAVGRKFKTKAGDEKEEINFFNCVAWGKLAGVILQYATKGMPVLIEGRAENRNVEKKDGTKATYFSVVVENFQMLGSKSDSVKEKFISADDPAVRMAAEVLFEKENKKETCEYGNLYPDSEVPF